MRAFPAVFTICLVAFTAFAAPRPARAEHMAHSQPEVHVGIVLFDGVEIIDFAGPYEVFGDAGFGVVTLSADGKPVKTAMGLSVTPDYAFANAPAFDVLLVPGGDVGDAQKSPALLDFIRQRSGAAKQVLSVCTGAFILGATGLLDGLQATTYFPRLGELAERYPKLQVISDQRWADDGKFVTAAGLSSGIDAALHVVAKLRSEEFARSTALHLEYDWKPQGGFVRGRMADRYLPKNLEKAVAMPADIKFDSLSSLGDERQWRSRWRVSSATPREELAQRIARGIDTLGWKRDAKAAGYRWHNVVDGKPVQMSVSTAAGANAGSYELELALSVDPG